VSSARSATACTATRSSGAASDPPLDLAGCSNSDGGEDRLAHRRGEPRVAFLGWGGGESERDASTCGVDQKRGVSNIDTEPPCLGDTGNEPLQHLNTFVNQ
jgi:hypothetical protein